MPRVNAFLQKSGGHIALATAVLVFGLLVVQATRSEAVPIKAADLQEWARISLVAFIGIGLLVLAISFPLLFWADVNTEDCQLNERRISHLLLYSYSVAALSLVGSLLPFLFVPSSVPGLYKLMLKSPVGIVLGCTEPDASQQPLKPLDCREPPYRQWVVNIGGLVTPGEEPKNSLQTGALQSKTSATDTPIRSARIQGGLVIPLYFVVLSLIGGAISLTRRVPEYQKRYSVSYSATEDKPKLDRATVREFLAFQIIQFISAPLLAVVAYFLITPESKSALVALGFTAGFASEAVLLMIRALVDKVSPASVTLGQTGAVSGLIASAGAGGSATGGKVAVVGTPALVTEADRHGHFVIEGVPIGDHVIEATAAGQTLLSKVTIAAGKTAVCHLG